jgi:hypothetical protein
MASLNNSVNGFFGAAGGGTSPAMDSRGPAGPNVTSVIVLAVAVSGNIVPSAILDSAGNIWQGPVARNVNIMFYITAGTVKTSATHTFTVTGAANQIAFVAAALGGVQWLDQQNTNGNGTSVSSLQAGPITPTSTVPVNLAAICTVSATTSFLNSTFSIAGQTNWASGISSGMALGVGIFSPPSPPPWPSYNPTWTFGGGGSANAYATIIDLIPLNTQSAPGAGNSIAGDAAGLPVTRPGGPASSSLGYSALMFGNLAAALYSVSGNVGTAGVLVQYTGPTSGAVLSVAGGAYTIPASLANGNYVITPTLLGWSFAPPSQAVTVAGFNIVGVNFAATFTGAVLSISGNAGLAGATVSWSGTSSGSVVADFSGNYTIPALASGTYTVSPSGTGYMFTPPTTVVVVTTSNVTGINFTATLVVTGHSISGNVGTAHATVNWSGGPGPSSGGVTADGAGNYVIAGLADGSYTVTPRLTGWSFSPTSRGVTIAGANATGVNFSSINLFQLPIQRDPNAAPASGQIIPLTVSANQTFSVNLTVDGNPLTLNLALRFSNMAGYWVLSIYDQSGDIILDSLPMVTGWYPAGNILAQYGYLKIGAAYLLNQGNDASDYPGTTDLGTGFQLCWGDTPPATLGNL